MLRVLGIAVVVMAAPAALSAQTDTEGAKEFALHYIDVLKAGDFPRLAELYDPDVMRELRDGLAMLVAADTSGLFAKSLGVRDSADVAAFEAAHLIALGHGVDEEDSLEEYRTSMVELNFEFERIEESPTPGILIAYFTTGIVDEHFPEELRSVPLVLMKRVDAEWRAIIPGLQTYLESLKQLYNIG